MKRFLVVALAVASVGLISASAVFAAQTPADDNTLNFGTFSVNNVPGEQHGIVAEYGPGMVANGVQASRHNLGSLGNYITVAASLKQVGDFEGKTTATAGNGDPGSASGGAGGGASEICVFCHTPHHTVSNDNLGTITNVATTGGASTANASYGPAPLWNRRGVENSYKAYGTTIGGTAVNAPNGVTLACLSCHDGVTSIDNLVNAPGEHGLISAAVADDGSLPGTATINGFVFQDASDAVGGITGLQIGDEARLNIGQGNQVGGTSGDLSNDHPMSVQYSDGHQTGGTEHRASLRDRGTILSSIDLAAGLVFTINTDVGNIGAELRNNLSQNRWAVKGFISGPTAYDATIEDLLRNGNVECSSCHDPHFKNLSNRDLNNTYVGERAASGWLLGGDGTGDMGAMNGDNKAFAFQDGLFLRRVGGNAGSGVCRTCHFK